ncbi:uncharacterized protein LOC144174197 [Haemaphysalis longicornis]
MLDCGPGRGSGNLTAISVRLKPPRATLAPRPRRLVKMLPLCSCLAWSLEPVLGIPGCAAHWTSSSWTSFPVVFPCRSSFGRALHRSLWFQRLPAVFTSLYLDSCRL